MKSEMILRAAGDEVKLNTKFSCAQLYPRTERCWKKLAWLLVTVRVRAHVVCIWILRRLDSSGTGRDEEDLGCARWSEWIQDCVGLLCSPENVALSVVVRIVSHHTPCRRVWAVRTGGATSGSRHPGRTRAWGARSRRTRSRYTASGRGTRRRVLKQRIEEMELREIHHGHGVGVET
jgi:hypothetical protein